MGIRSEHPGTLGSAAQADALRDELAASVACAATAIRDNVLALGERIIAETRPTPHALNLTYSEDGDALFTLVGANGREAELWLRDGREGFMYVLSEGASDDVEEGAMQISEYPRIARWLRGDAGLT